MKRNRILISVAIACLAVQLALFFAPVAKVTQHVETSYSEYESVTALSESTVSTLCSTYTDRLRNTYERTEDSMDRAEKREAEEMIDKFEFYGVLLNTMAIIAVALLALSIVNTGNLFISGAFAVVGSAVALLLPLVVMLFVSDMSSFSDDMIDVSLKVGGIIQMALFVPAILSLAFLNRKAEKFDTKVEREVYKVLERMDVSVLSELIDKKTGPAQPAYTPAQPVYAQPQPAYAPAQPVYTQPQPSYSSEQNRNTSEFIEELVRSAEAPMQSNNEFPTIQNRRNAFCVWCGTKLNGNETVCPVCTKKLD